MNVSYTKHKERLRERYKKDSLKGFHDYEVLELILSYAIIRKDTKPIAKELIDKFKSLTQVLNAPIGMLTEVDGVGERTASLIKLFKDVGCYHLRENILNKDAITSSQDVYEYLKFYYKGRKNEEFKILYLNTKNVIVFEETLFTGTVNEAKIYVRTVIEHVIHFNASSVIIVHNHPSGNLKPSSADINLTTRLHRSLMLVEVGLLDHIIIGDNDYMTFVGENLL